MQKNFFVKKTFLLYKNTHLFLLFRLNIFKRVTNLFNINKYNSFSKLFTIILIMLIKLFDLK